VTGDVNDALIFSIVAGGRLIIPLFIFRFPLPAIIAALFLDAADDTVFQAFTNLDLENYQSYDKALDIYYLSIAYIATMRNWSNVFAFRVSRFLWYYRLAGSTLFELSGIRAMLLIFPNTFEYFFIYIEAARTRWNTRRLTRRHVIAAAAIIWLFIKLPQEYWIHVAQLDTTDFLKEEVLRMPAEAGWGEAIGENLWVIPVVILAAALVFLVARRVEGRLPEADWPMTFDADVNADEYVRVLPVPRTARHWREGLLEKIVLVALITIVFASMLPNVDATLTQIVVGVAVVIAANAFISHWLADRGTEWTSVGTEFAALAVINFVLGLAYVLLLPTLDGEARWRDLLFFTLLLTLLVTLYDRYRPVFDLRCTGGAEKTSRECAYSVDAP
jgi:hypothetical protein